MTLIQILAVCACLSCIFAKWILAYKLSRLERILELERTNYRTVRNELNALTQQHKVVIHNRKQMEAKSITSQRNIGRLNKTRQSLLSKVEKEEEVKVKQKELIHQLNLHQ